MTQRTANCPSCGAEITFRWSGAVQTTCSHCRSILVRRDVDFAKVGTVSEPPPVTSRIQLGTQGRHGGKAFTVVGRIAYGWQRGGWSEWHVVFDDGKSGWLSDAQAEYAVTFHVADPGLLPKLKDLKPGKSMPFRGATFEAASITRARYEGVEGELPFEYWDHAEVPFVDLRSDEAQLATIDFSENPPLLFVGESVNLDSLELRGLREEVAVRVEGVRTLNCPACAGSVMIRHAERAVTVACEFCGSVLDARSPEVKLVQAAHGQPKRFKPLIPLGSRGRLRGHEYEVIGFQVRTIHVGGSSYSWREYLLFNAESGYRYLTEYDGHWNDIITPKAAPKITWGTRRVARLYGESFRHFQSAHAETQYVLGEFPWEVRRGDRVTVDDYVSPPRMLSSETTGAERTWSLGEYTDPAKIWKAFGLEGQPPRPKGVFANQPSPGGGPAKSFATFGLLAVALAVLLAIRFALPHSRTELTERYFYDPTMTDSATVVAGPFVLAGRPSNLEVQISNNRINAWTYFNMSLLNVDTGETVHFGREIAYYEGLDADGRWSEGSIRERPRLPSVPAGVYMLRIVPEGPTPADYFVTLRRDVPQGAHFLVALLMLAAPAVWSGLQYASFEQLRWRESDYGEG